MLSAEVTSILLENQRGSFVLSPVRSESMKSEPWDHGKVELTFAKVSYTPNMHLHTLRMKKVEKVHTFKFLTLIMISAMTPLMT